MDFLTFFALAFAPGLFWLWFFARRNIYRPDPKRILAGTFFLGMLSTFPAGILNSTFISDEVNSALSGQFVALPTFAASMFFVVGPVEETLKFLAVRIYAYRSLYFDEPMDGMVYAAAASLGFASLENLYYIYEYGPEVMVGRSILSTLGHVVFGSFWGYALGIQAQQHSGKSTFVLVVAIVIAAVAHGIYNTLLFADQFLLVLALFGLGVLWTINRFNWARRVSPFKRRRNYPKVACSGCGRLVSLGGKHCSYCGVRVKIVDSMLYCSHCRNPNQEGSKFCTNCGDQFLLKPK